jgi:hypothetical protein
MPCWRTNRSTAARPPATLSLTSRTSLAGVGWRPVLDRMNTPTSWAEAGLQAALERDILHHSEGSRCQREDQVLSAGANKMRGSLLVVDNPCGGVVH